MSQSFLSKLEGQILKKTKPKYMTSKKEIEEILLLKSKCHQKHIKSIFKSFYFKNIQIFRFGKSDNKKILYLHGGAFINEINYQHLFYCFLLSKRLNAEVFAPVYPLAPKNSYKETFDFLAEFYKTLDGDIIMMGDSAGGGIVFSFCQYLNFMGINQPKNIITFSPWVDLSMSGNYSNDCDDPILGKIGLEEIGKSWAGSIDVKDFKISPLYGNNQGLAKTLIFTGTDEIFYSDILKYYNYLKKDGVDVRLVVGEKLFHIYPMFPIPEAKQAFKEIKKEIM